MWKSIVGGFLAAWTMMSSPIEATTVPPSVIEASADALRSDSLYVADDAERQLSTDDAEGVRSAIRSAGTPVYVAILPASAVDAAGGAASAVARQVTDALGRPGTYAIVVGDTFRAGSSELEDGLAGEIAGAALAAHGEDETAAVLVDFVERVGDAASGSEAGGTGETSGDEGDDGGIPVFAILLVAAAGVIGFLAWRAAKRRKAEAAERRRAEEADRQLLRAELSVLADDVVRLETTVRLHPDAQTDFDAAANRYRAAQAALEYADEPVDLVRVERVVVEARYSMDRARAIIDGREPPPPPEELQRPGRHGEPAVTIDDDRQPAYVGYPGGFQGGWFGGGSGLFTGLLLGSMFGGWGYGGTTIINEGGDGGGGDGGGADGGDFGGGDFGGGDFGGGDFGGGDFGGGDFGGGDFGG